MSNWRNTRSVHAGDCGSNPALTDFTDPRTHLHQDFFAPLLQALEAGRVGRCMPCRSRFRAVIAMSNPTLCPTITQPSAKSRNAWSASAGGSPIAQQGASPLISALLDAFGFEKRYEQQPEKFANLVLFQDFADELCDPAQPAAQQLSELLAQVGPDQRDQYVRCGEDVVHRVVGRGVRCLQAAGS